MSLFLNGQPCASMTWTASWNGVWIAEVDMMPTSGVDAVPSGRVSVTTASGIALFGTVDPTFTAAFADRRRARVLGGGGGWGKEVRQQHYHDEAAVQFLHLLTTTANEIGEVVLLLEPTLLGPDYVRHNGPASQVFSDAAVDWWLDAQGVTRVGTRPLVPASADVKILDWNPSAGTMTFTADKLVEPGTIILDERFGRRIVRKVEARIADAAISGTLYVAESAPEKGSVNEVVDAIGKVARDATGSEYSSFYEYFVDAIRGDQVELIAVTKKMPNLIPVNIWAGASGYRAKLRPGVRVLVGFREDKSPFVAFYQPPNTGEWRAAELEVDALGKVTVGEQATSVIFGDETTSKPIARAPAVQEFADAIGKAVSVASAAVGTAGGPIAPLAAILETMGKSIDLAASMMNETLSSSKVKSS